MLRSNSLVSRLAAAALLVLLLLAGYQAMVRPLVALYQDNRETITRSEDLLQRYLQLAAEREGLNEHLAALERDPDRLAHYVDESSDTLAAAAIQDRVAEVIAAAGGEVKSLQILPADAVDGQPEVRRIGLKLWFAAPIDGLAAALHQLESPKPSLFIEDLVVTAPNGGLGANQAGQLDIRLAVFGYARDRGGPSVGHDKPKDAPRKPRLRTDVSSGLRALVRHDP